MAQNNFGISEAGAGSTGASGLFDPSLKTHPQESCCGTGQGTYSAKIITPMDSMLLAAMESAPRSGSPGSGGGSGFGDRLSSLGSSISHMVSDFTHSVSVRAHDTLDVLSHTAHDWSDAVTHADYKGMIDETRRTIASKPERNLLVAAGVGLALGLIATRHKD